MKYRWWLIVVALILMVLPGVTAAQDEETDAVAEPSTNFATTVDFSPLKRVTLEGKVGEVDVTGVEFTVANKKSGGFMGVGGSDTEIEAVITTRLGFATTADTKWKLDMMVEFLDEDGEVVDRVTNSDSIKKNEKNVDFKHTTLRWALSHIKQARITVDAKQ